MVRRVYHASNLQGALECSRCLGSLAESCERASETDLWEGSVCVPWWQHGVLNPNRAPVEGRGLLRLSQLHQCLGEVVVRRRLAGVRALVTRVVDLNDLPIDHNRPLVLVTLAEEQRVTVERVGDVGMVVAVERAPQCNGLKVE